MTRRRHHFSLVARIRAYYDANPDEELTFEDLRTKFGASDSNVRMAVSRNSHLEFARVVRLKAKGVAS